MYGTTVPRSEVLGISQDLAAYSTTTFSFVYVYPVVMFKVQVGAKLDDKC